MNTLAKLAGTTLFGGAMVVGTAGVAFADGGSDSGQQSQQGSTQPSPTTDGSQVSDQSTPDQTTQSNTSDSADSDSQQGTEDGQDSQDSTSNTDGAGTSGTQSGAASPTGTDQARPFAPPPQPRSGSAGVTSPSGTATQSTTPPAFCADASMLQSFFSHRQAALSNQIAALGRAEGAAASSGNTAAVQADRARIAQLNQVASFLRAADAQLISVCGSA